MFASGSNKKKPEASSEKPKNVESQVSTATTKSNDADTKPKVRPLGRGKIGRKIPMAKIYFTTANKQTKNLFSR